MAFSQMLFSNVFADADIAQVCEESKEYLSTQILTYLGNKRALLDFLGEGVAMVRKALGGRRISFFDAFSGSGIVSRYMKQHATLIVASDLERYSEIVNRCYLTNKSSIDWDDFNSIFCRKACYERRIRILRDD